LLVKLLLIRNDLCLSHVTVKKNDGNAGL